MNRHTSIKTEKEFLRSKFIELQLGIADLTHALKIQEQKFLSKEIELYLNLFELSDSFENLNDIIEEKKAGFDKSALMLARNIQSLQKKLVRVFKANHVLCIEFPDNKARMEYCKVIETREVPDMENEKILSVVKNGYINKDGVVLRKAEVVTVLNNRQKD
ncbi:MAG: nucleotide exchange factor GrpE [Pseudomonadota bacterium]